MDRYSPVRVIGEGSFGRALVVQSVNEEETFVMKEIRLPRAESAISNSRREAVLLSKMKHPNIVAFRDSFEADGHLYIVMEFCSGGDLLQRIQQQKNVLFSEDMILKWFTQMCLGTKYIHDKRVLHRDLKSKNIFLTDKGTVKVGDFGSACTLNSGKAYAQTYVGTPYYVSPEIWDNKPYNNKSDVWSLGCVLYELCSQMNNDSPAPEFQACSWKSLILKVCRGAYAPLPNHFPYEVHYLIKHMFKTNPRDRPSVHTILNSHRVSRLLNKHLTPEGEKLITKRECCWRKEEGEKVAVLLGQKSLVSSCTHEGRCFRENNSIDPASRKRWEVGSCNTVLGVLGNADIISCGSMATAEESHPISEREYVETQERRNRKQWDKDPPERLLSMLEKAQLCSAFETYTIHRHGSNSLGGPLSPDEGDGVDGPDELITDNSRLETRSDDEDTDFEEDCPYDWINELEKMVECC